MDAGAGGGLASWLAADSDVRTDPAGRAAGGAHRRAEHPRQPPGARALFARDPPRRRSSMNPREQALEAHRALLNGSGKLSYFLDRGISEEVVKGAYVGYEAGAFTYPCIA